MPETKRAGGGGAEGVLVRSSGLSVKCEYDTVRSVHRYDIEGVCVS